MVDPPLAAARAFRYSLWARPGRGTAARWVWPLLSPVYKRTDLGPLGILRLDPALVVGLSWQRTDPTTSTATGTLPYPKDPALVGMPLYLQALVEGDGGSWHLSNLSSCRFQP